MDLDKEKSDVLKWLVFISEYNLMQLQQRTPYLLTLFTLLPPQKVFVFHTLFPSLSLCR